MKMKDILSGCSIKSVSLFIIIGLWFVVPLNAEAECGYETNKFDLKAGVEGGGWTAAWADDISETDVAQGLVATGVSIYSANPAPFYAWVEELIRRTIQSLSSSIQDRFSQRVIEQANQLASEAIKAAIRGQSANEVLRQFDTVDFKAGAIQYAGRNYCKGLGQDVTLSNTWGIKPYVAFRWRGSGTDTGSGQISGSEGSGSQGPTYQSFILHTGTALHETGEDFDFVVGDWNRDGAIDLIAIKKRGTGSNSTEVHVLNGASNFSNFILHTGTALHETGEDFDFAVGDWNRDGSLDLVAIKKKSGTGSNSTEVHILNGASNYSNFILQTSTALHETGSNFDFAVTDWNRDGRPDLIALKKSGSGTNSTEVHILDGASNFSNFLLQTGTALHETGEDFDFVVGDWNRDGAVDLIAVKKNRTGSNSTEVHILNGALNFSNFLLQTGTPLHQTSSDFDFVVNDIDLGLFAIKKRGTGTNSTEVHALR